MSISVSSSVREMVVRRFRALEAEVRLEDDRFRSTTGIWRATEAHPIGAGLVFLPYDLREHEVVAVCLDLWEADGTAKCACEILVDNWDCVEEMAPEVFVRHDGDEDEVVAWVWKVVMDGVEWAESRKGLIVSVLAEHEANGDRRDGGFRPD